MYHSIPTAPITYILSDKSLELEALIRKAPKECICEEYLEHFFKLHSCKHKVGTGNPLKAVIFSLPRGFLLTLAVAAIAFSELSKKLTI